MNGIYRATAVAVSDEEEPCRLAQR